MISESKKPTPGGAWVSEEAVDCSRHDDSTASSAPSQYTLGEACAFLCAAGAWHRDVGLVRATTPAESRRSALALAFAAAFLHRAAEADRLDRLYVPSLIAGTTRHTRAARILAADARMIAARADSVAAEFLDQLWG
jgi:hypothetical protein